MKLKKLAWMIALIGIVSPAMAQEIPSDKPIQRVEITGTSIRGVAKEGALPIDIITRQQLDESGIVTAEQLLNRVSANGAGAFNMSTQQGSFVSTSTAHNGGASSANLRGLGPENTLVLLNGRRVATHGLNGQSVDLNSIPLAAIDRVEILKDGASAIYGTDAIGGVINFILKKNFRGLDLNGFADVTQEGGGNVYRSSVTYGHGNLEDDRYNFLISLAADKSQRLEGRQRSFQNGYQPERGLAPDTTGTAYATQNVNFNLPGDPQRYTRANLLALQGKCGSFPGLFPYPVGVMGNPNFRYSCAYDYGADTALMQPVQHVNLVSRASFKLGSDTTAFVELVGSHTKSNTEYTPLQFSGGLGFLYPAGGPYYQDLSAYVPGYNKSKDISLRWRCLDCGDRKEESISKTYRLLTGIDGTIGAYDYKLGLSIAGSSSSTDLIDGYVNYVKMKDALYTGKINPWLMPGQTQTPEAMALIEGAKIRGPQFGGRTKLYQLDGTVSREWGVLPGGAIGTAVGFDLRREEYNFAQSSSSINDVFGAGDSGKLDPVSRNVGAVYTEVQLPLLKNLQVQGALRYDHYSRIGGTTNPKIGVRYEVSPALMFRGSWNRGFHVPDFEPLYGAESPGQLNNPAADPLLCPKHPGDPTYCNEKFDTREGSNPNLRPERSKQYAAGVVIAPVKGLTASLDYWHIKRSDRIEALLPEEVLANAAVLASNIVRKADGTIDYVRGGYINVADDITRGVDLSLDANTKLGADKLAFAMDGTWTISHKARMFSDGAYEEEVGNFGTKELFLRWKHSATVSWTHSDWITTLNQLYSSGYKDQAPPVHVPGFVDKVGSYTLYNLSLTYKGIKNTTINVGIKNLLNTDPPFSAHNVDLVAGAGWDARVGDPRGRSFTVNVNYKFQ